MAGLRIVSLLAAGTEILFGLDLGDQVVGVSHECDYPAQAMTRPRVTSTRIDASAQSAEIDRQVCELAGAGAALYDVDLDRLASLRPDLIVTQAQCDVCAVSKTALRAALNHRDDLNTATVVALNPVSLNSVLDDILRVGEAAGCLKTAQSYVAGLRARLEALKCKTDALDETARPRVICLEWIEPPIVAANWMPTLVEIAGGRNGLTMAGSRSGVTKWDDVVACDPEIIVVMPCGFPLERSVAEAGRLKKFPGWSTLSAVRGRRAYAVDGNAYFNRSGPRLIESTEFLAGLFHPSMFTQHLTSFAGAWRSLD